jgi:hypothetical protein
MARPNNNYFMDYEDTGSFGEPTIDEVIAQLVAPSQPVAPAQSKTGVIDALTQQILAQGTASQWTGEGKGSAEANAKDMASILADTGITDISQFGAITKTIPATSYETEQGTVFVPEETVTTYGNKATGQEVANTYGERQQGNAFGGTYTGEGNTGYRVSINPDGTPVFYTTSASSNDLANILEDPILNVAATVAANYFGGPAGVAALNAVQGKSAEDVAKSALLAYAGNEVGKAVSPYLPTPEVNYDSVAAADTAGGLIPKYGTTYDEIMSNLVGDQGSQLALQDIINPPAVATPVPEPTPSNAITTTPMETVQVSAPAQVPQAPVLSDVISAIVAQQAPAPMPEMVTTADRPKTTQEVIDTIAAPIVAPPEAIPELVTTDNRPRPITEEKPSTITDSNLPIPVITPSAPIDTKIPEQEKKWTAKELADLARLGLLATTVFGAANSGSGPTQYDIVPVPADWKSPVYQKDLPATQLSPIDFGNRNLLVGTQWEKFLDPNYGQVPAPVQFNQPSNMSYDRLMGILGTGRDTSPSQALSINDVISGIQNQYGQAPKGTVG